MIICTAATKNSPYESLLKHHRDYYGDKVITLLLPEMDWNEGTKIKPMSVIEAFKHDSIVLWMDADCQVNLPDEPPEGVWDMCVFNNIHPDHTNRISAAFILFRDTLMTRRFLVRWDRNNKHVRKDHPALTRTIREMQNAVKIQNKTDWLKNRHTINALLPERGLYT